jgi:hypothetical protein
MGQPGDAVVRTIYRKSAGLGLPVTGKVTADFTVGAWLDGVVASVSASITEIGSAGPDGQAYKLAYTNPGTKGRFALRAPAASPSTDIVWPEFEEEIENNDNDSLYNVLVVPVVSVVSLGGPQGDISLRVVNGDYAPVSFTVKDQSGAVVDLSGYNNAHFRVWNKLHATMVAYDQTAGITMTAGGLVTIGIPEGASFYSEWTTSEDPAIRYWQFTADQAADATKTRTLARGTITILRKES